MKKEMYDFIRNNEIVCDAYLFASMVHEGQIRKSGVPYITHPLEVATMLLYYGADKETITAAFLHDVVEDTEISIDEIRNKFGNDISFLVYGVTKESKDAALYKSKLIIMSYKDSRIAYIKAVDKIHNLKTKKYLSLVKQKELVNETKSFYLPFLKDFVSKQIIFEIENCIIDVTANNSAECNM